MESLGKKFEKRFETDWVRCFPTSYLKRLYDQVSGYKTVSRNECDYISYVNGKLYLIELKTVKGNTFPFSNLRQYDLLLKQAGKEGIVPCVIIWFYDRDTVLFVPVTVCRDMISEGKKSIRFDDFAKNESIISIPSTKIRTFMESDYTKVTGCK